VLFVGKIFGPISDMSILGRIEELWRDASLLLYLQGRWLDRLDDVLSRLRQLPIPSTRDEKAVYEQMLTEAGAYLAKASELAQEVQEIMGG